MEKFTYTAQRAQYISFVIVIAFVATIESAVFFVLSALLLPDGWRLPAEILVTGLHLFLLAYFIGPLLTAHYLTADALKLHYSLGFRVTLPRTHLIAAVPVKENLQSALPVKVIYTSAKQEASVAFSDKGQVRLYLDKPYRLRTGWLAVRSVRQILINVNNREQFLTSLNLPDSLPTTSKEKLVQASPAIIA